MHEPVNFTQLPGRVRWFAGIAAAVLLLSVGVAVGVLVPILRAPSDESVDAGYARDMSLHHGQAVEMSMIAFRRADSAVVRTVGYDMAATQQWQIGAMQTWLVQWDLLPTGTRPPMAWMPGGSRALLPDGRMPGMASPEDLTSLKQATGKDFDILWCQLMLRHHLGGIHMSEIAAVQAAEGHVRETAGKILRSQQSDIELLRDILTKLGGKPLS
ncbi:DUF305 domain-containing protein [Dactylosporangium sp. NPDC049742]|uniref:DUF305 domain-containing protein n=1 Tax=Dactylosporangium sp. NPDC049742 TaxID=3154737 RepID=UPI00343B3059